MDQVELLQRLIGQENSAKTSGTALPFCVEPRNRFGEMELVSDKPCRMYLEENVARNGSRPFPMHGVLAPDPPGWDRPFSDKESFEKRLLAVVPQEDLVDVDRDEPYRVGLCVPKFQPTMSNLEMVYEDPLVPASMDMKVVERPVAEGELDDFAPAKSGKEFTRGKIGNVPFRPGGMSSDGSQQVETMENQTRNQKYFTDESIRHSLIALGVSEEATRYRLKVPPGLEEFEESLLDLLHSKESHNNSHNTNSFSSALDDLEEIIPQDLAAHVKSRQQRQEESLDLRRKLLAAADALLYDSDDDDGSFEDDDDDDKLEEEGEEQQGSSADAKKGQPAIVPHLEQNEHDDDDEFSNIIAQPAMVDVGEAFQKDIKQSEESVAELEDALSKITEETSKIVAEDFFGTNASWQKKKLSEQYQWAITKPIDTSAFRQVVPHPAMSYPFELDDFQKQAIMHLETGDSVFVAAHTSAGKTVVAEYAIAMAMRQKTRVIYTSPIKALSNQKFRDFSERFSPEEVGLVTGDVTINGTASCLVMTTEILRSMLYRGADLIRDLQAVIFDEIHYINDSERGVVWEEVIIMLPEHVNLIFLSATTPNTVEFSSWVGRTKRRRVHVISTERRPVPLQHYIYTNGKMFMVLDENKNFLRDGYKKAVQTHKKADEDAQAKKQVGKGLNPASKKAQEQKKQQYTHKKGANEKTERNEWSFLIKDLEKKELLPAIVFSFSKRMCDERAAGLQSLNLTTAKERSQIHRVFHQAVSRLQGSDRYLPQVLRVEELISRGIGVHHGGLLPILKEVVEILFAKGLVKVLFATESMAIGVNLPARCIVYNGLRKHDGTQFRDLLPSEYTQMAGRAGRRGLDTVGTVIIAVSSGRDPPAMDVLSLMLTGSATKLTSQFRLSYRMVLSLLRVAEMSVADMIKRSFSEFGSQRLIGGRDVSELIVQGEKRLKLLKDNLEIPCSEIQGYDRIIRSMKYGLNYILAEVFNGKYGRKVLGQLFPTGRIVLFSKGSETPFTPGSIVKSNGNYKSHTIMLVDGTIVKIKSQNLVFISGLKVNDGQQIGDILGGEFAAPSTHDPSRLVSGAKIVLCPLDPVKDLKIGEMEFVEEWRQNSDLAQQLFNIKCHTCKNVQLHLAKQAKVTTMEHKLRDARRAISDESLALFPDFEARLFVLKRLGYISREDQAVQLKGRVACEINTCDELLLTEMIFNDVFGPLLPEECAALCSALVMERKSDDEPVLTENLRYARDRSMYIASKLEVLQNKSRVEMDPDFVNSSLNFGLVEAVYEWARGMPFRDITKFTSLEEGSIVRVVTRLDDTCREVRNAAKIIGDGELFQKFEKASEMIKRDIIFAASLYVS